MPSSSDFVAAIIRRKRQDGKLEDLVIDYEPKSLDDSNKPHMQLKYPGGRVEHGETHYEALKREVREETGLKLPAEKHVRYLFAFLREGGHMQYFFIVEAWRCKGWNKLKSSVIEENDSVLSNQRYEEVSELYPRLYKTHRDAFAISFTNPPRTKQCA